MVRYRGSLHPRAGVKMLGGSCRFSQSKPGLVPEHCAEPKVTSHPTERQRNKSHSTASAAADASTAIRIYCTRFDVVRDSALLDAARASLPADTRRAIERFRRVEDRAARHISLLFKSFLFPDCDPASLRRSEHQRPYFPGQCDFNVSHSGNYVIAAIAPKSRVGIDIEQMVPVDLADFTAEFTAEELRSFAASDAPLAAFFRLWTLKEAVLKADGRGLNASLREMFIGADSVTFDRLEWHYYPIPVEESYPCHLATDRPLTSDPSVTELSLAELLEQSHAIRAAYGGLS